MPFLDCNQQTTCNDCGGKVNLSRNAKWCASGTKACPHCPNFFCNTQTEMDHHTARERTVPSMIEKAKFNICEEECPGCYSLQRHKKSVHSITSGIQIVNVNLDTFMGDYNDQVVRQ